MCLPHCILAPRSCKALLGFGLVIYDDCGDYDDDGDDQLQRLDGGRVPRKEQRMEEAFLQRSLVGTTPHCTKCASRGEHFSNQVAAAACALLIHLMEGRRFLINLSVVLCFVV